MQQLIKFLSILVLICMFLVSSLFGQETVPIPVDLAKTAALYYAKQSYGDVSFYSVQTYYDLDGEPEVYAFILKRGNSIPQDIEQLRDHIRNGYARIGGLESEIQSVEGSELSGKQKAKRIAEIRAQMQDAQTNISLPETYVTVLAGANENHVPIILHHEGLPEHLIRLPQIHEAINNNPSIRSLRPTVVYYLGLFDQHYALSGSQTSNPQLGRIPSLPESSRLIHLRTGQVEAVSVAREKQLQKKQSRIAAKEIERENIIRQKWEAIKRMHRSNESSIGGGADSIESGKRDDSARRSELFIVPEHQETITSFDRIGSEDHLTPTWIEEPELQEAPDSAARTSVSRERQRGETIPLKEELEEELNAPTKLDTVTNESLNLKPIPPTPRREPSDNR